MTRTAGSKRVGEIELLRFIFCMVVCLFHSKSLFGGEKLFFGGGAFAVEFFFLVSGYLMMASVTKLHNHPIHNLGEETARFLLGKVKPIYLELVLAFIVGFSVQCLGRYAASDGDYTLAQAYDLFKNNVFEVLLVERFGLGTSKVNSAVWYVQSMVIAFVILYPLARKFPEFSRRLLFPFVALLLLGWMMITDVNLRNPSHWYAFGYKSNVRAIAELCLGGVCYTAVEKLKAYRLTALCRTLLAAAKWFCWLAVLRYLTDPVTKFDAYYLLLMCMAIILTFSRQCVDTRLYQNRLCLFLGRLSLPIYVGHIYYAHWLNELLGEGVTRKQLFIIYVLCVVVTAGGIMLLAAGLRRLWPPCKRGLKRLLIQSTAI